MTCAGDETRRNRGVFTAPAECKCQSLSNYQHTHTHTQRKILLIMHVRVYTFAQIKSIPPAICNKFCALNLLIIMNSLVCSKHMLEAFSVIPPPPNPPENRSRIISACRISKARRCIHQYATHPRPPPCIVMLMTFYQLSG